MFENALEPETKKLFYSLSQNNFPSGSYLAGGTALALQIGHRISVDLDFFTPSNFDENQWEQKLQQDLSFQTITKDWQTLNGTVQGVKIQLLGFHYGLIHPLISIGPVQMASCEDIAGMKLNAIISRAAKRDFIDLYFLGQKFGLEKLLDFYGEKFKNLEERKLMLKKALAYFADADADEMPNMLIKTDWNEVKKWFTREVKNFA